tara:strand:- start:1508 stop:3088 length:1581 start_codon:yes stop_codon:yes gene_type:complete
MAENNGLLSNQNLDKIFGITPGPAQSLLGNNFDSQKNVATFAPFLAPIMQQGFTPEALLKGFVGAGAARQGVEDRATKNYMTQQDILTQTLNARKTQGDLQMQPFQLQSAQAKSILDKGQVEGMRNLISTLPPHKQNELAASGAPSYFANNKLSQSDRIFYQAIGVDNIFNIPQDKVNTISEYNLTMNQSDADTHNALEAQKQANDPMNYIPNYVEGKLDFSKRIINQTNQQPSQNKYTSNNKFVGYKTNENNEKIYHGFGGERFTEEQMKNLGRRQKLLYNEVNNRDDYKETYAKIENDKIADMKIIGYGIGETRDVARNIEKILDNPSALKKLFTTEGRLRVKINDMTDNFFAEFGGDAQDVKNFIETLKAKQFTVGIQKMRTNNPTGGAVGNVSDKEVAMFQSMEEFLDISGSGKNMYVALKDLYNKTKETQQEFEELYRKDYGQDAYSETNLPSMTHKYKNFGAEGYYADSLEDALLRGGYDEQGTLMDTEEGLSTLENQIEIDIARGREKLNQLRKNIKRD